MEYNKIIINNNLLHYTNEDNNNNNYISSENLTKNNHVTYKRNINPNQLCSLNNNTNNLLKNHLEINERENIINNNFPFSSRGNYRIKNDIYPIGNIEKKRVNKTPQARIYKKINYNNNDTGFKSNYNNFNNNFYHNINDIRVDYCLQMLNLNNIKNIFHQRNIGFQEMLYLSQNDMKKMGIPKYSQLIIQKFTKDYLEKASFYTAEELEKFFQIYFRDNIRKIISNKNIELDFPIRSFSPIVNKSKNFLNKYNYDLNNIDDFSNSNEKRNDYNQFKQINNNAKNNFNYNYPTNLKQRNCLSASQRRKGHNIRRKGNKNKNIRFLKSSNLYPNSQKIRYISSPDSKNFVNKSPVHRIENISDNYKLNYYPNKFISTYSKNTKISKDQEETNGVYKCLNLTDNLAKFYWQKHTKFGIPKVFVNLYFFHPYLRPNTTDKNEQDYIFFHEMLYISYLKRELNFILGDAIRAGGSLEIGFTENFFFLDVSYYSDKIKEILKIIYEKIISKKDDIIEENLNLYKDYALNDLLNFDKIDIKDILRYEFFKSLTAVIVDNFPPVYNYYKFNKNNFINFTITNDKEDYLNHINAQIVRGFMLGYCEEKEAKEIYNIFKDGFNIMPFQFSLQAAKYTNDTIPPELFVKNCLYRKQLDNNLTNDNITELSNDSYLFMSFTKYTYENRILVELLKKIGQHNNSRLYRIESIHQKDISLRFNMSKNNYNGTDEFKKDVIKIIEKNKNHFTEEQFDVVGDSFYYMVTNLEIEYSKTPNSMRNCSFSYSYDELYELNKNTNNGSYKIDRDDYESFTAIIKNIFSINKNSYFFYNNHSHGKQ